MTWLNVQPATVQDGDSPPAGADGLVVICDWDPPALHADTGPVEAGCPIIQNSSFDRWEGENDG